MSNAKMLFKTWRMYWMKALQTLTLDWKWAYRVHAIHIAYRNSKRLNIACSPPILWFCC